MRISQRDRGKGSLLRGFELGECSESVIIVRLTADPMIFLHAIPCPAVSLRRSFSAKMGALTKGVSQCVALISVRWMEPMGIERHRWEKPKGRMSGSERGKITEDVRKHAAERGVAKEQTLASGMAAKVAEFTRASADVCAKM